MIQVSSGRGQKIKRKKEPIMKKLSILLEELYASFIHGKG